MHRPQLMLWYLLAILGITLIGVSALVILEVCRGECDRGLFAQVIAIVIPTLTALLALLRGEANGAGIREVSVKADLAAAKASEAKDEAAASRQELHANTEATRAIGAKIDTALPP